MHINKKEIEAFLKRKQEKGQRSQDMMRDNIHKKVHRNATMAYQRGVEGNRVLFVFESPGKLEHQLNRPVAGKTGVHLCMLCESIRKELHNYNSVRFPNITEDMCKDKASIINVAADYLPEKAPGKHKNAHELNMVERKSIASEFANRNDFQELISHATVVVCFGRLAWDVGLILEDHLKDNSQDYIIMFSYHLSGRNCMSFIGDTWETKMKNLAKEICTCLMQEKCSDREHSYNLSKFKYKQVQFKGRDYRCLS